MESEKVKEIKKALECMSGLCKDSLSSICFECEVDKKFDEESACKDALTLINELESENDDYYERATILRRENEQLKTLVSSLENQITKLKDRIAELTNELEKEQINNLNCDTDLQYKEKRIAELEKENAIKTEIITDLLNKQEFYEKEKLKQFAERLKEKVIRPCDLYDCVTVDDIEETLKEFINECV